MNPNTFAPTCFPTIADWPTPLAYQSGCCTSQADSTHTDKRHASPQYLTVTLPADDSQRDTVAYVPLTVSAFRQCASTYGEIGWRGGEATERCSMMPLNTHHDKGTHMVDDSEICWETLSACLIPEDLHARAALLLTIPEAAAALRISRSSIYRLFDAGELSWVLICGKRRVSTAEINRFIAAHTQVA